MTEAKANEPPGKGGTDKFGNMWYSTAGTKQEQALAYHHEKVHQLLSPKLNFLREFRADVGMTAYQKLSLCRYLEEALAETYAQFRVNGVRGLPEGIAFPIKNGYVTLHNVVKEAAIGTVAVGGVTYGVYIIADSATRPDNNQK